MTALAHSVEQYRPPGSALMSNRMAHVSAVRSRLTHLQQALFLRLAQAASRHCTAAGTLGNREAEEGSYPAWQRPGCSLGRATFGRCTAKHTKGRGSVGGQLGILGCTPAIMGTICVDRRGSMPSQAPQATLPLQAVVIGGMPTAVLVETRMKGPAN